MSSGSMEVGFFCIRFVLYFEHVAFAPYSRNGKFVILCEDSIDSG